MIGIVIYSGLNSGNPGDIGPWTTWAFQQYRYGGSGGTCPGVTGPVDLDSFNGDSAAFNSFLVQVNPALVLSVDPAATLAAVSPGTQVSFTCTVTANGSPIAGASIPVSDPITPRSANPLSTDGNGRASYTAYANRADSVCFGPPAKTGYRDGTQVCRQVTLEVKPTVAVTATDATASEAGSSPGTFRISRTGDTGTALSVYFTMDGTAANGSDYGLSASSPATIPAGNSFVDVVLTPADDGADEDDETATPTISNNAAYSIGSPSGATVTIQDNDPPPPHGTLQFSSATYNVNENGGSATVTVSRTNGSAGAVGVSVGTSDGTATAGQDYTAVNSTLSWADGVTGSKTFTVTILDDTLYEGNETVNLALSNATGGASLGAQNTAVLTIIDDDPPPPTYAWQPLGTGLASGTNGVFALAQYFNVVAGGSFAGYLAQWNGAAWQSFGGGAVNNRVYSLLVNGNDLIAGGSQVLARWNGTNWLSFGSINSGAAQALRHFNGDIIVGGGFINIGGITNANNIAAWNAPSDSWHSLGTGVNGYVYALDAEFVGDLFVGGQFSSAGFAGANNVARWHNGTWSNLGNGFNGTVRALKVVDPLGSNTLYAAGDFTASGTTACNHVARWNSGTGAWEPLSSGVTGSFTGDPTTVFAVTTINGQVAVGGNFTHDVPGGTTLNGVARWDGQAWQPFGTGFNRPVLALNGETFNNPTAGGTFTMTGDGAVTLNGIAKWAQVP